VRIPDLEACKKFGEACIASAELQLRHCGCVVPMVVLLDPVEGEDVMIDVDPRLLMSENRKDSLAGEIKRRLVAGGFTAVASMFDAHSLEARSEAEGIMIMKLRSLGMQSDQINARFKIGIYTEMVLFAVETIDARGFELKLAYRRDAEGDVVEVEPVEFKNGVPLAGRMKFFEERTC